MLPGVVEREQFDSYDDFYANYKVNVKENFNFARDVVDEWARLDDKKRALVWENDSGDEHIFTFEEISRLSKRGANFLKSQGIKKGDRVMCILRRRWEYWVMAVAMHRLGAIIIPASNQLTVKDIVYRVNAADVKMLISCNDDYPISQISSSVASCPGLEKLVVAGGQREGYIDLDAALQEQSGDFPEPDTQNTDIMLIYFTSGTTGMPKMVVHDFTYPLGHTVTARFWHGVIDGGLHYTASDSGWAKFGWGCIYGQWIGGSAILGYDMDKFDPGRLIEIIRKYRPDTFCVPPTMYRFLMKFGLHRGDMISVKHCSTAGEPLAPEVHQSFEQITGLKIYEGLGQSESSVMLGNYPWFPPRPGSMGKPSPLYDIVLLTKEGEIADIGETGEIVVRNLNKFCPPGLFKGYFDGKGVTCPYEDGNYHLGDMAYRDEDGYYWFVGRNDDMIKCSGYRIGPFEIESVLLSHPAVLECAITGAPDPERGQVVKATIVLGPGYTPSDALIKELQTYVKKGTAPYKYPRVVEFVKELPKTTSGKISRVTIRKSDGEY